MIPIAAGGIAAAAIPVAFWDTSKTPLLTALSVIAAGVLVRLARGLPFNNSDQFELHEARRVATAIKKSARTLRALIVVAFIAMGGLVFAKPISDTVVAFFQIYYPSASTYVEPVVSGTVALLLTYVFIRVFAVIKGDVALVDLQTDLLVHSVERKQAERFDKSIEKIETPTFKTPEGYGKVIQ